MERDSPFEDSDVTHRMSGFLCVLIGIERVTESRVYKKIFGDEKILYRCMTRAAVSNQSVYMYLNLVEKSFTRVSLFIFESRFRDLTVGFLSSSIVAYLASLTNGLP